MITQQVLNRFNNVKKTSTGWMVRCPAHEDKKNSLSITEENEKTLLKCHVGCVTEAVLSAVGLKLSDLYADKTKEPDPIIARYDYTDEEGTRCFGFPELPARSFSRSDLRMTVMCWV